MDDERDPGIEASFLQIGLCADPSCGKVYLYLLDADKQPIAYIHCTRDMIRHAADQIPLKRMN